MSVTLGLTGSIGMGKSTTAQMFRDLDVPVWDADAAVHHLYAPGGGAVAPIGELVPEAIRDGGVDRVVLKQHLAADPSLFARLESIVHPLVAEDRSKFRRAHENFPLVVFDIPLLFETGGDAHFDATLVVTTDASEQRRRVLARGTSEQVFEDLLARQISDADKRHRATYVIRTDTREATRKAVADLVSKLSIDTKEDP
ncbi:dephospho-CoA kinase [Gymnodinialimonas sp. 2305UL16-5]|uniref:dephospho-CoA kinase n=1 Tax=Gymnodinialimonas mytili TaxID=3126503 RepID=UPI0030B0B1BF